MLHAGDDSTTTSLVPSGSSASVNSTVPSSAQSNASRRSGSTSVTVALRSSPFDQRKLAPPPGPQVEVDVVREPVLEPVGIRERLPHVVAGGGQDDFLADHVQPPGCYTIRQLTGCTLQEVEMLMGSVVPMVVEQDGRWERSFDIYSRLLRERIVFLGQEVNDDLANLIAAQLLHLDAQDPGRDIYLYVNSPGGSAYAGMAIYDAMQYVKSDVSTVCLGMGMSAAAMILCGGAPGKRFALPNAKVMIHQGSGGFRGTPADIQIAAREILDMTKRMAEIISRHSGQDVDQVLRDIDRDRFMTPEEAVEYGLVDAIMETRAVAAD